LKTEVYPEDFTVTDYIQDTSNLGDDPTDKVQKRVEELEMGFLTDMDFT
jgi:hypothetical protein